MGDFYAELHCHLGGSTPIDVIRKHAGESATEHLQRAATQAMEDGTLTSFLSHYFGFLEKLQSTPEFLHDSARGSMLSFAQHPPPGVARGHFELRFNPFCRPMPVMDQVRAVHAGLSQAQAECGMSFGLVLIAERGNYSHLSHLVRHEYLRFITGVDVAGPENHAEQSPWWIKQVESTYHLARAWDLITTYHSGEGCLTDTLALLRSGVPLTRIGHGVVLRKLPTAVLSGLLDARGGVFFELCPVVNERTGVATVAEVCAFAESLDSMNTPFAFCSDNPAITGVGFTEQLQLLPPHLVSKSSVSARRLVGY